MTAAELTSQIMALPAAERAAIAQKIWESIEGEGGGITATSEAEAVALALRRDQEISQGDVAERSHDEVMKNARRSVECE